MCADGLTAAGLIGDLVSAAFTSGVVLLNNKMLPIANRVFGVIPKKIIKKGFLKIASLAFATL